MKDFERGGHTIRFKIIICPYKMHPFCTSALCVQETGVLPMQNFKGVLSVIKNGNGIYHLQSQYLGGQCARNMVILGTY
jgi:hypothetical protein